MSDKELKLGLFFEHYFLGRFTEDVFKIASFQHCKKSLKLGRVGCSPTTRNGKGQFLITFFAAFCEKFL